ncbi:MAG: hypothetical protein ACE5LC_08905 [Candidatus Aminicenantales bacterium]
MKRMKITHCVWFLALLCFLFTSISARAEQENIEELKKDAPKVYIDCGWCDIDYIRTEITFVNYVRERKEAQIHILITTLRTGSGGREYTIAFIGQHEFEGYNDTHKYYSKETDTEDEIRKGLVKALKIGLMSYTAKTPIARRIKISYAEKMKEKEVKDRWNFWVFRLSGSGRFRGEESYKSSSVRGSFSASRVTPEIKLRMSVSASHNRDDFTYDDQTIKSTFESMNFSGLLVKSISEHWSAGIFFRAAYSTYENVKYSLSPAPAVEFNLFPYSQFTRRQLRFLYRIGYNSVRYLEETIYNKTYENLFNESLSVTFDVREKWGSVSTTVAGSHYFHDFKKNRLTLFSIVNLRLFKGLNFFVFGGASVIHDQLSLPKGGLSLEEILLRRKQLETNYSYWFSIGLSFTFGSIYTNVVNPRFGSGGYGGVSIMID